MAGRWPVGRDGGKRWSRDRERLDTQPLAFEIRHRRTTSYTIIGPQSNWRPIENEKMRSDIRKPDGKITTTTAIGQIRNKIAADSLDWKRQRRDFVRSEIY